MDKYITSLKDLIAETFRNSFKLNESAKNGDPKACFISRKYVFFISD